MCRSGAFISRSWTGEGALAQFGIVAFPEQSLMPVADGHPETMKMIPLLFKEGSGVVGPAVTLNPPPPPPPPAEEGGHFQGREEVRIHPDKNRRDVCATRVHGPRKSRRP